MFTLSSILSFFTNSNTCWPAVAIAPIGITSGSTTMSAGGMPKSEALSTIFFATLNLTSGSSDIPVSSLDIATTGTLYFFTRGRILSSLSSSPVTEFSKGLPFAAFKPSSRAPGTELSIHNGTSTVSCTSSINFFIKTGSVSFGFGFEL